MGIPAFPSAAGCAGRAARRLRLEIRFTLAADDQDKTVSTPGTNR
jgi:hypothetical protein